MTTPLTQAEKQAIYNLAVGYTEGYKAPYKLVNSWSGYTSSVTSSTRQANLGLTLLKGATYDQIVSYQTEKDANGILTARAVEANKLITDVKRSLGSSGYPFIRRLQPRQRLYQESSLFLAFSGSQSRPWQCPQATCRRRLGHWSAGWC